MQQVFERIRSELLLIDEHRQQSRRLFHGRGHCYEGLTFINVDYHPSVLFITLYQKPEPTLFNQLVAQLVAEFKGCIVAQRRYLPFAPTEVLHLTLPEKLVAVTDDMQFSLSFDNQNIGYFIDMQSTHQWLRANAHGKKILNLFSYTCAFSVAALKGGATAVVNVDMSHGVLKSGKLNHELNNLDDRSSRFMKLDILKSWGRIAKQGPYDVLIIDPPSNQRGSFIAENDYVKVLRRIPQLMGQKGQVLACLNAPHLSTEFLIDLMAKACPQCQLVERLPQSTDFPELDPQRALKALLFTYENAEC